MRGHQAFTTFSRGSTHAMPPNARKAPRRGGEGGESSNVVRSEDDGSNEERDAARERKAALRNQHLNVLRELRERGKKMLLEGGMQQLRTEGVGDCWLIGLLVVAWAWTTVALSHGPHGPSSPSAAHHLRASHRSAHTSTVQSLDHTIQPHRRRTHRGRLATLRTRLPCRRSKRG